MRRAALAFLLAAAPALLAAPAMSQTRVRGDAYAAQPRRDVIRVTPRSFLDAGKVAPVGSLNRYATVSHGQGFAPYAYTSDRFGEGVLPSRGLGIASHDIFLGRNDNPFGPVDYVAPDFLR